MTKPIDLINYMESSMRPVSKVTIDEKLAQMSSGDGAKALAEVRSKYPLQIVAGGNSQPENQFFVPTYVLKKYADETIPSNVAKGLCKREQDVYPMVCHDHCINFDRCAETMMNYSKNHGIEWLYGDGTEMNNSSMGKRLKRAQRFTSE